MYSKKSYAITTLFRISYSRGINLLKFCTKIFHHQYLGKRLGPSFDENFHYNKLYMTEDWRIIVPKDGKGLRG